MDAVSYWSLEPSKHVLVNESKVMWPSTANVRDAVRSFAAQNMGAKPVFRLYNREREVAKNFAWLEGRARDCAVKESKESDKGYGYGYDDDGAADDVDMNTENALVTVGYRDREGTIVSRDAIAEGADDNSNEGKNGGIVASIINMVTFGSFAPSASSPSSATAGGARGEAAGAGTSALSEVRPMDSFGDSDVNVMMSEEDIMLGDGFDQYKTEAQMLRHEGGTDLVKAAIADDDRNGVQQGGLNDIQIFRHLEMFIFLLFIVIYSNTMFMRRQVYQVRLFV